MIEFNDLPALHSEIRDDLDKAIADVLDSGIFVLGPAVDAFERAYAEFCQTNYAVALNSGTSALHLALLAAGIGPGDEVITVSMTFAATVAAIIYTGATPVLVDVDSSSWTMDPLAVEQALSPNTKAILPVHLHGRMTDMEAVGSIADQYNLRVVEDAAQAHGAQQGNIRPGSVGEIAAFSFYPGKNLGALGEGGAVVTDDRELAERVRQLRDWGSTEKFHHLSQGFNYRMDALQGAALGVKLAHLDRWTDIRRDIARCYDEALNQLALPTPHHCEGIHHVYHVYATRVSHRPAVVAALDEAGIGYGIHYPIPIHLQPAYRKYGVGEGSLPVTEQLGAEFLSLPMHPGLSTSDVERVVKTLETAI